MCVSGEVYRRVGRVNVSVSFFLKLEMMKIKKKISRPKISRDMMFAEFSIYGENVRFYFPFFPLLLYIFSRADLGAVFCYFVIIW